MSQDPFQLTSEILDRFVDALRHAGAPLGDEIQPGLSDDAIDHVGRQIRVEIPPELRVLWRWGVAPTDIRTPDSWDVNPEFQIWPPATAIKQTKRYRKDDMVSRSTIAFGGPSQDAYLLVEGGATKPVSPVVYAFIDDPDTLGAAPSLGALFTLWTEQLAAGDYRYTGNEWEPLDGPTPWIPES